MITTNKTLIDMINYEPTKREELLGMFSDLYKSVNGMRPFLSNYSDWSDEEVKERMNSLQKRLEEQMIEEELRRKQSVIDFKKRIQDTIDYGAENERRALRWIVEAEGNEFFSVMDVDGFLYSQGIIYTDYGKELKPKLMRLIHRN